MMKKKKKTKMIEMVKLIDRVLFPYLGSDECTIPKDLIRKAKISSYSSFFGGFLTLIFFLIGFFLQDDFSLSMNSNLLAASGILAILSSLVARQNIKYYFIPGAVSILLNFLVVTILLFEKGGLFNPIIMATAASLLLSAVFFHKKGVLAVTIYWIAVVFALYYKHQNGEIQFIQEEFLLLNSIMMALTVVFVAVFAKSFVSAQGSFEMEVLDSERKAILVSYANQFSFDLRQPLNRATGLIEESKSAEKISLDQINKLSDLIAEMESVVKKVKEIEGAYSKDVMELAHTKR
jgi:hypothetical protein